MTANTVFVLLLVLSATHTTPAVGADTGCTGKAQLLADQGTPAAARRLLGATIGVTWYGKGQRKTTFTGTKEPGEGLQVGMAVLYAGRSSQVPQVPCTTRRFLVPLIVLALPKAQDR